MTLPAIGNPISFDEIKKEFGAPTENRFGNYRISQTVGQLNNLPLDTGIPQSGIVSFSNFYSKKQNIVVDLFSNPQNIDSRVNAKSKYTSNEVVVIGPGDRPEDTGGKKIIVHVNKTIQSIYSGGTDNKKCALRTGNWDTGTDFTINVGTNGYISGTGGNGGTGGSAGNNNGGNGTAGTSAIGINDNNLSVTVINNGTIRAGYGGGGGGAGRGERRSTGKKSSVFATSSGGGGGGGAGIPTAERGGTAPQNASYGSNGDDGDDGNATEGGDGGTGGSSAGAGGHGGDTANPSANATKAPNGSPSSGASGGIGGDNGYAILRISGAPAPSTSGNSIIGRSAVGTPT